MNPLKSFVLRLSSFSVFAALLVSAQVPAADSANPGLGGLAATNVPVTPALPLVAPPLGGESQAPTSVPVGEPLAPGAAVEAPKPAAPPKPVAPKLPGVGLRGAVKSVDPKAMTVTVAVAGKGKSTEHVVQIVSSSRYSRDGKAAIIADLAIGDSFNGRVKKKSEEILITGAFKSAGSGAKGAPNARGKADPAAAAPGTPKQP